MKKLEIIKKIERDIEFWEEKRRFLKSDDSNRQLIYYCDGKLSVLNEYIDYLK